MTVKPWTSRYEKNGAAVGYDVRLLLAFCCMLPAADLAANVLLDFVGPVPEPTNRLPK